MLYLAEAINIIKLGKIDSWEAMIQKILFGSLFSIGIVTNSIIIYKIIKSKLGDFKPVHVYQINFFSGLTMIKISGILLTFFTNEKGTVSVLCHILMFFSRLNIIHSILIQQLDRFAAIQNPLRHHSEVTVSLSFKIVSVQKILSILIVTMASIFDPSVVQYQLEEHLTLVRPVNIYTCAYPSILVFFVTLAVSAFASFQIFQLSKRNRANRVQPSTNMTAARQLNARNLGAQEEIEIRVESVNNIDLRGILRELESQQSTREVTQQQNNSQDQTTKMLMSTLKMNIITLILFIYIIPTQLLNILNNSCYEDEEGCTTYNQYFFKFAFVQFCVTFIHPLLVLCMSQDMH